MKRIKRIIGSCIWDTSEALKIPIGRFDSLIFGWMIGSKGKKVLDEEKKGK